MIAIRNRVIGVVPRPTHEGLSDLRLGLRAVVRNLPKTGTISRDDFCAMYSGPKRARYQRNADYVRSHGFSPHMAGLRMFIKWEKLSPEKVNPDPRPIQYRDGRYCVEVSQFLKPIEQHLYQLHGDGSLLPPTRLIAKGLNQVERAKVLRAKLARFVAPVVVSLDASRFDKHVDIELLKIEHKVYKHCNPDPYFAFLLTLQLINYVRTLNGIKYTAYGKRMSGDMNTALGNCILMIIMLATFCIKFLHQRWDMFDDGDDCLLIVEREELDVVLKHARDAFLSYGHEIKVEKIAYTFPTVMFCQSCPVEFAPGKWKFVRNPRKVLSCALMSNKWKTSVYARRRLLATIGLGELILNMGVPVLQSFSLALIRSADGAPFYEDKSFLDYPVLREMKLFGMRTLREMVPAEIFDCGRLTFAAAFGIPVEYQIALEAALDEWRVELEGDVNIISTWDPVSWVNRQEAHPERYL